MLAAHVMRNAQHGLASTVPIAESSAYRLHQVLSYIRKQPEREHRLDELAKIAGVAPSHFCRIFRKAMGMAPGAFVTRVRMEHAQSLLRQVDLSISEIAEATGYSNQSAFTRAFHSYAGITPRHWRDASGGSPFSGSSECRH
jgi:AraC family transcriptional regulator